MNKEIENNFLIYETEDGKIDVNIILKDENIWLSQKSLALLFDKDVKTINKHILNIFEEEELKEESTISKFEIVQQEGNRNVKRNIDFYNLDMIIAVGYRVNSKKATQFRIWSNKVLKNFIIKGYVMDKERLKNGTKFGKDYFNELLQDIKEIRLSERRLYQKITDLFETSSTDFKSNSKEAYTFFKIIQNKLHYAISGKTAAELIFERVDSKKINMGLTTFINSPNGKVRKSDISIAKNYLNKDEIKKLESITILFLDYAEDKVINEELMTMNKWIEATDKLLEFRNKKVLDTSGNISHIKAITKAETEYEKYKKIKEQIEVSAMDQLYEKYLKEQENENGESQTSVNINW